VSQFSLRIWPSAERRLFNVVHWNDFDTGGHFAAMETPTLLVDDIRSFFAMLR
jgi:epoxide hydrolase